jgi:NitT/TauT family transport system substrate-binding protein
LLTAAFLMMRISLAWFLLRAVSSSRPATLRGDNRRPEKHPMPRFAAALAAALLLATAPPPAAAQESVRMILNWRLEGPNAPFFLAEDRGFFREEGLTVRLDPGEGSSAPIGRIAAGTYDAGFGDINTMIEFTARQPERRVTAAMVLYTRPPMAVVSLARANIQRPQDLIGRRVGAPQNDTGFRLFPAFAALAGIDASRVSFQAVAPTLRETLLVRGEVEAVTGFDSTVWFALKGLGIRREDVRFMYYGDHGVEVLSNAVLISTEMAERRPQVAQALTRAIARGWVEAIRDPRAAVAHIARREPLLDPALEVERLQWVIDNQIATPEARANGIGHVDPARLDRAIEIVAQGFSLPRRPTASEILDTRFLPSAEERRLP